MDDLVINGIRGIEFLEMFFLHQSGDALSQPTFSVVNDRFKWRICLQNLRSWRWFRVETKKGRKRNYPKKIKENQIGMLLNVQVAEDLLLWMSTLREEEKRGERLNDFKSNLLCVVMLLLDIAGVGSSWIITALDNNAYNSNPRRSHHHRRLPHTQNNCESSSKYFHIAACAAFVFLLSHRRTKGKERSRPENKSSLRRRIWNQESKGKWKNKIVAESFPMKYFWFIY